MESIQPRAPADPYLLELLAALRLRPGMFLHERSVRALRVYLWGYWTAREELGAPQYGRGEEGLMEGFAAWLRKSQQLSASSADWAALVEIVDPDEQNIATFYELSCEYLSSIGQRLPEFDEVRLPVAWLNSGDR